MKNYYHGLHTRHSLPEFDSEKKPFSILCPFSSGNLSNDTGSVPAIFIHVFDLFTANITLFFFFFNQFKFYLLVQKLKVSTDVYFCSQEENMSLDENYFCSSTTSLLMS